MFDTKQTDFKISNGPFANNSKANVAKYVFDAFRKNDFMIGAYFSKPDWHSENYWWPAYATANRNNNYDIRRFPWRWNKYKEYTFNQISELMHEYGSIDILWLDGGWVRPLETVNDEVRSWGADIPKWSQDIDMPKIAAMARTHQPGLLVVDRTVHGEYENYVTPEQQVPATYLPYPWESCITLGNSWSYVPGDQYKSSRKVIHMLTDIISKNGNLLLNVGPGPDGEWDSLAYNRLEAIGKWMKINGEAVYDTDADPNLPRQGKWAFTRKGANIYAIYQVAETEMVENSLSVNLPAGVNVKGVSVIGGPQKVKFTQHGGQVVLFTTDKSIVKQTEALVFKIVTS
jgi:alpha-L-fucosidase